MRSVARNGAGEWGQGSFLDRLTPDMCGALLALAVQRQFQSGHRLLREGGEDKHIELLLQGFVKVTVMAEGTEALLAIRVPGDILGETAALTGRPRTATVTACGRVTSSVLSRAAFRRFLERNPEAAVTMATTMGERLRWANQRRTDFATYSAEVRLARILIEIARTCGHQTDEGIAIGVPISQPELATMIGIAEVTAQKAIRDLRKAGLIRTGYRHITVLDLDALRAVAKAPTRRSWSR